MQEDLRQHTSIPRHFQCRTFGLSITSNELLYVNSLIQLIFVNSLC